MSNDEKENIRKLILSEDPELKDLGWEYIKQTIDIDKLSRKLFEHENIQASQSELIGLINLCSKGSFPSIESYFDVCMPIQFTRINTNTFVGIILLSL